MTHVCGVLGRQSRPSTPQEHISRGPAALKPPLEVSLQQP
jgi:hypothetical protein